jgi:hypothetical protein
MSLSFVIADQRQKAQPHTKFKQSWDLIYTWKEYGNYVESTVYNVESTAYNARTTAYNCESTGYGESTAYNGKSTRIMAKAPRISAKTPRFILIISKTCEFRSANYKRETHSYTSWHIILWKRVKPQIR